MTNEEALELLKDTNLILRCSFTGDIRIVEAIDMAIKALDKDIDVPTKEEVIPVDWIENYLSDCEEWSIAYYVIKQMLYKWREEREGE